MSESETPTVVADAPAPEAAAAAPAPVPAPAPEPEEQPELGKHVLIDPNATGTYGLFPIKGVPGYDFARDGFVRTLLIPGIGWMEHTDTHASGVWCYRKM